MDIIDRLNDDEKYVDAVDDAITEIETLRRACGSAIWLLSNRHNKDAAVWEQMAQATMKDLRAAVRQEK